MLANHRVAARLPRRRVWRSCADQVANFVCPTGFEHPIHPRRDSRLEAGTRIHHQIRSPFILNFDGCRRFVFRVKIADTPARKESRLDCAQYLSAAEMRSCGVKLLAPAAQLGERLRLELALEVGPLDWVDFRRGE